VTRAAETGDQRLAVEARTRQWLESNYRQALAGLGAGAERLWDDAGSPHQVTRYRFQQIQRKADRPIAAELLARLRCSDCRAALAGAGAGARCVACGAVCSGEHGVPIVCPTRLVRGAHG